MPEGPTGIPHITAELIALCVESLFFGGFTVLYLLAVWILFYRGTATRSRLNKVLFATSTVMWILSVVHICIDTQRATEAFIVHGNTADGSLNFYSDLASPTHFAKNVIYISMTLLGDSFATYRLFVIWNHNWWIVVLPIILIVATAVTGFGACAIGLIIAPSAIFSSDFQPWLRTFFSLSLAVNLLDTILIAVRVIQTNRQLNLRGTSSARLAPLWAVIETIVQSAAIYSIALIALISTYIAGTNAQYICLDALQPLIGAVFTLIIIRVGLGCTLSRGNTVGPATTGLRNGSTRATTDTELALPTLAPDTPGRPYRRDSVQMYEDDGQRRARRYSLVDTA
ncbi:uncharacterized protein BXZ73DRAFT_106132 [Epithele typhae]|uniref:uncharacterized protein n=1 Tax=Epithele typhae TaxID=378194 RepID=UPI002008E4A7|nr:uncharacterized protein BXZ73DRAFT_106132 [Epithele typhae]KAH9915583.1 hypothetical protein BXZ73DRAFT_106132 [Epithele typhae]